MLGGHTCRRCCCGPALHRGTRRDCEVAVVCLGRMVRTSNLDVLPPAACLISLWRVRIACEEYLVLKGGAAGCLAELLPSLSTQFAIALVYHMLLTVTSIGIQLLLNVTVSAAAQVDCRHDALTVPMQPMSVLLAKAQPSLDVARGAQALWLVDVTPFLLSWL